MTNINSMPFDFTIGGRNSANGDRAALIYNPRNDKLLFDFDGKGGDKAVKVGKITSDDMSLVQALDADVVFGTRKSPQTDGPTIIVNPMNGNILYDEDGAGGGRAVKVGHFDLDI